MVQAQGKLYEAYSYILLRLCMHTPLRLLALYQVDFASISSCHSCHPKLRKLVGLDRDGEKRFGRSTGTGGGQCDALLWSQR